MAIEPLLRDTQPVSHELVQRFTTRMQSFQAKVSHVKLTHERPSNDIFLKSPAVPVPVENHTPIVAKTETKTRKRQRLNYGSDGEVLPRKGLFAAFLDCRQKTIQEIEPLAIWAFHVFQTYRTTINDSKEWMRAHWNLSAPTAFCAMYGKEELSQAPALIKYEQFIQIRYPQLDLKRPT